MCCTHVSLLILTCADGPMMGPYRERRCRAETLPGLVCVVVFRGFLLERSRLGGDWCVLTGVVSRLGVLAALLSDGMAIGGARQVGRRVHRQIWRSRGNALRLVDLRVCESRVFSLGGFRGLAVGVGDSRLVGVQAMAHVLTVCWSRLERSVRTSHGVWS